MFAAYVVVAVLAIAATGFSGVAALVHFKPILPGMAKAGVPESWLTFPIGTLKTAGAVGLLLGVIGVPLIGTAAAIGLILFLRLCSLHPRTCKRLLAAVRLGERVPCARRGLIGVAPRLHLSPRSSLRPPSTSEPRSTTTRLRSRRKAGTATMRSSPRSARGQTR